MRNIEVAAFLYKTNKEYAGSIIIAKNEYILSPIFLETPQQLKLLKQYYHAWSPSCFWIFKVLIKELLTKA